MKSIPGCTEPKTYGEARSQLEDVLKMLSEAHALLLWWRHGKSMTLSQCAHLNEKTDVALARFGLSEAEIDRGMPASAEPTPQLVECDACPRSSGCVGTCMKAPASAEPSAPVERDERAAFDAWHAANWPNGAPTEARWLTWQARAALERKP